MKNISDDILVAFADGELGPEAAREVEASLAGDPVALAHVRIFGQTAELLRAAFAQPAQGPVPEGLSEIVNRMKNPAAKPPRRRFALPIAASLAAAAIGVGGFAVGSHDARERIERAEANAWLDEIAEYHVTFSKEDRHLVEVGAEETPHLEAWLGKRLNRDLRVPDLSGEGARFLGGRLIVLEKRPAAFLIYRRPEGRPIALCVRFYEEENKTFATARLEGVNLLYWARSGYAYAFLGWERQDYLRQLAAAAAGQLEMS